MIYEKFPKILALDRPVIPRLLTSEFSKNPQIHTISNKLLVLQPGFFIFLHSPPFPICTWLFQLPEGSGVIQPTLICSLLLTQGLGPAL